MKKVILMLLVSVMAIGCATRPEAISSSYVPHERFENLSCVQLTQKLYEAKSDLATLSAKQNSSATIDNITVFLFLIPASALTGNDQEGLIAETKGTIGAVETSLVIKGC